MCALIFLFSYRPSIQSKDRPPKCPRAPRATALRVKITRGVKFVSFRCSHIFLLVARTKRPRPKHAPGALTMPGWRRASRTATIFRACQRLSFASGEDVRGGAAEDSARTRLTTAHRRKTPPSTSAVRGNHSHSHSHSHSHTTHRDLRRGARAHPNRICATPRCPPSSHTPPDMRIGAPYTCAPDGRINLYHTTLPNPPAGPSEGLA